MNYQLPPPISAIETSLANLFNQYLSRHSKALPVRFDIRYPNEHQISIESNTDISRCMAKTVQNLKREGLDPYYIWVREQDTSNHPHYHCLLLLNGNKVQNPYRVFSTVEKLWGSTINTDATGLVHHCMKGKDGTPHENGIMLRQSDANFHERFSEVQQQVSYLAKPQCKADPNDGLRDFGMTRVKNTTPQYQ